MPMASVKAVGIDLTASAVRQQTGREGHVAERTPTVVSMPTATVGIYGALPTFYRVVGIYEDLPTAFVCRRFSLGRRLMCMYADGPDKKPSAY